MALLGALIDQRTLAVIAAAGTFSYAHGLPAAPDTVFLEENATTNSTGAVKIAREYDATNVSLTNHGAVGSATLKATAVVFHAIIR